MKAVASWRLQMLFLVSALVRGPTKTPVSVLLYGRQVPCMVIVECLDEGVEGAVVFYCWPRALMLLIEPDAKVMQGVMDIQRFVETCRCAAYFAQRGAIGNRCPVLCQRTRPET